MSTRQNRTSRVLYRVYETLYRAFGPQYWWPGETPLEVAIGAILTQNTNWSNVEKAIDNIKKNNALDVYKLNNMSEKEMAELIRPSGYFNIKTRRLKSFIKFLVQNFNGIIENMEKEKTNTLRESLLSIHGIGNETADSILLYAFNRPAFVIDVYTKRVLSRHNILSYKRSYEESQSLFHQNLKNDVKLFNEYHALFVKVGKLYCKREPVCNGKKPCPLRH